MLVHAGSAFGVVVVSLKDCDHERDLGKGYARPEKEWQDIGSRLT